MDTNSDPITSDHKKSTSPLVMALSKSVVKSIEKIRKPDEFTVIFKGEALDKLEELATYLDIPADKLGDVLIKGIHIIDLAKGGRLFIETPKSKFEINLKKL